VKIIVKILAYVTLMCYLYTIRNKPETMKTTTATSERTQKQAENLSTFLYGYVTFVCQEYISRGEEECTAWMGRICEMYHLASCSNQTP
jgi:hypothetical protein